MRRLHPVFNIIKLTPAPVDPIPGRRAQPHPPPVLVDDVEEYEVEEILDSRMFRRRLQFKVRYKGFTIDHDEWVPASEIHADEMIAEFYARNPAAPRLIQSTAFNSIFPDLSASGRRTLEGG
ncbi:poly protein, partial [Pholiota molesta]